MIARVAGVAALVVAVLAVALVAGRGDSYELRAVLPSADGLREGSLVRVGGVDVGTVADLEVAADDTVHARLELDEDTAPVGRDADLRIRAANLLGEKYVELGLGDRTQPLGEGSTIPVERVRSSVEIDDVIDVLDPSTRARLAILLREAGIALGGRGDELADTLRRMPPAMEDVHALFEEIGQDTEVLSALARRADRVVASIADEREDLGELVETAAAAFTTLDEHRAGLGGTLRELHPTLRRLRSTLRSLDLAGAALRPAVDGLRETAPTLTATLDALPGFTDAARPALATARRVAPDLTRLGREATPVVKRLRPTSESLRALGGDADALTGALDVSAADLLGTMENWARAIQGKDGIGHLFRVSASFDPAILGALREYVTGPPAAPAKRRGRPAPRTPATPQTPAATAPAKPAPAPERPARRSPLPALPKIGPLDLDAVTEKTLEATDETVGGLLDFLLRP